MTTPVRIVARLDIKGPNVVKGIQLEGLRVVGKPNELARRYYEGGADEIVFIDTVASLYGRNNILDIVRVSAEGVFVPMTVGGGLRTLGDIAATLRSGADKVAINTAAVARPAFLEEAAVAFGSQAIVLSVHAKRTPDGRDWEAFTDNGREHTGRAVLDWVAEAEHLGAGEVLLTSVDRDGTRKGFDLELVRAVSERISIPVIAAGGAGTVAHVAEVLANGGTDTACCGTLFHYALADIATLKRAIVERGLAVRL